MSPSVKPFNEAKYKALMDGLECSEIRFNEIHNWNPIFRIDAEFYNKRAITIDTQIRKMSHLCLNKEDVVSGPFGSTLKSASYLSEGPVPFIRIENIKGGFYVNTLNIMYISEKDNNRIKNSALRVDDIVLSKVGNSIGYFARIDKRIPYCNISENNIGIKLEKYQPIYDDYKAALKTEDTVYTLCNLYDKNFVPKDDVEYAYIELANVGNSGDINDVDSVLGKNLPSRARRKVKSGQVIIASVEGSLQSCALITDEYSGALCSTGFYVVDSDYINPESLLVLFKSKPIQALLKQRCSGTILTAITKDEFLSMPLPKIEQSVQKQIATKVQESFALRHQSEQLLENAKRAVEIAIELGEEKAMKWLKGKNAEV